MKKWYIMYVSGEAEGLWPVELDDKEFAIAKKIFDAMRDGLYEDYCGSTGFHMNWKTGECFAFDTKEEALSHIRDKLYDPHGYGEEYDEEEEEEEEEDE